MYIAYKEEKIEKKTSTVSINICTVDISATEQCHRLILHNETLKELLDINKLCYLNEQK